MTFVAEVLIGDQSRTVFERTVTRPHRWEEARLDLAELGGREVELKLSLRAGSKSALGFWGSPEIRDPDAYGTARPPSVLLIIADTLRLDHLDLYGYGRPTVPALSRFARNGVVFRHCVAQATWTTGATGTDTRSMVNWRACPWYSKGRGSNPGW